MAKMRQAQTDLLYTADVLGFLHISRSTLHRYILRPDFPKPGYTAFNKMVWYKRDIIEWRDSIYNERLA